MGAMVPGARLSCSLMPWSPKRACLIPGCPHRADGASDYCALHRRRRRTETQDARGTAAQRGYTGRHRSWRKLILGRDPLCRGWPRGSQCLQPTTVADHVVPIHVDDRAAALRLTAELLSITTAAELARAADWRTWLRFSRANGQGLCSTCHGRKTQAGL